MPVTNYEMFPSTGFTVTHFLVSADIRRSLDFYSRILGGNVVMDGENGKPCIVQLENTWVIINVGGGPTDDKPAVYLAPPKDGEAVSSFMNIRVANIAECYERWKVWVLSSSLNRRFTRPRRGVTCATPTATSSRSARRKSSGELLARMTYLSRCDSR